MDVTNILTLTYRDVLNVIYLAHLTRMLKWAFLIEICRCPSLLSSLLWQTFRAFDFFSRTTGTISTKRGTKHPWVKRKDILIKWRVTPFITGDNDDIAKINQCNFKTFVYRVSELVSTKFGIKHPCGKGTQVLELKGHFNSRTENKDVFS